MNCIQREFSGCLRYFTERMSHDDKSYGLIPDRYPSKDNIFSIAATGFGLAAFAIAHRNGIDSEADTLKCLQTVYGLPQLHGFFYHFYDRNCERLNRCELSTIDTALLIAGAVTAGEYFGGRVKELADGLYDRIDWQYFYDSQRNQLRMAQYDNGFSGYWDHIAEQLILYVLGTGANNRALTENAYYGAERLYGAYGEEFIYSWYGSLFTHQFSQAFVDFRSLYDRDGVNWFDNSVRACRASYRFCRDNADKFKDFDKGWGLSASDVPNGYNGRAGSPPSGRNGEFEHIVDGTIPPYAAISSIVFTPDEALEAIEHYYRVDGLCGEYGLFDAYNATCGWIAKDYLGIDKGITLMMLSNYTDGFVWSCFNKNHCVQEGLKRLGFVKR